MSDPDMKTLHDGIGRLLGEVAKLATSTSELHVKHDSLHRWMKNLSDDRMRDRLDVDRVKRRVRALERQVETMSERAHDVPDWRPDPSEVTGTHAFAVIKAKQDEMLLERNRDEERRYQSGIWWKRTTVKWVAAAAGAVALLSLGGCAQYIMAHLAR